MKRVLIVDDDPQFADIMKIQLQLVGCEVNVTYTRAQALEAVKANVYDVILQDVFFPNRSDGLQLLKTFKDDPATQNIPVILLTSLQQELFMQEPDFVKYLEQAKELISKLESHKDIAKRVVEIVENK